MNTKHDFHIGQLLATRLVAELSKAQKQEWDAWLATSEKHRALFERLQSEGIMMAELEILETLKTETSRSRIMAAAQERFKSLQEQQAVPGSPRSAHRIHFLKTAWVRYAAAIIILFGIGAYLWNTQQKKSPASTAEASATAVKNDILPGSNRAILTLSDGRKIELTSETKSIAETGINIANENGKLAYGKAEKVVFNTMSTPRGGQYQLTLPDGTNVWLNAASSITYPTAFTTSTREVIITGEAYFEVKKNPAKPFVVKTPKENINVLGTTFNVNAYANEDAVKTSLVEGSVKVGTQILKPGQACVNGEIRQTDVTKDVAWKNGLFSFTNADIYTVMRQLARWYDVEVEFARDLPAAEFNGKIGRTLTLQQVMTLLTETKYAYQIQNKTITILPKK
jgi:transmembrane sensor